jgi:hypothetical protein
MNNFITEQPAPRALWEAIHSRFPYKTRFLGILMPPGHQDHSEGRALDIGIRAWKPLERELASYLIESLCDFQFEVNWSYLIWNRQIWYADRDEPLPYENAQKMPHTEHIHISWSRAASQFKDFTAFENDLDGLRANGYR